ncbi:MAG: hypothetical protein ABII00_10030 [Elusimicrobiota bacterium]
MDCEKAGTLMNERLDGPLSSDNEAALRRHCEACPVCAEERRLLAEAVALVVEAPLSSPTAGFDRKVLEALGPAIESRPAPRWVFRSAAALGCGLAGWAAAAVLVAAWFFDPADARGWVEALPAPAELPHIMTAALATTVLAAWDVLALAGKVGRVLLLALNGHRIFLPMAAAAMLSGSMLSALFGRGSSGLSTHSSRRSL